VLSNILAPFFFSTLSSTLDKGCLLVSTPTVLDDFSFSRSVVLVTDYSKSGCVGFVLNHRLTVSLDHFIPESKIEQELFRGGPVEMENLYYIHRLGQEIPNSIHIDKGLYWSGNFSSISEMFNRGQIKQSEIKFFLGYAGWGFDQLKSEIDQEAWVVVENTYGDDIIKLNTETLWKNEMSKLGGRYTLWANAPEDPQLN